MPSSACQTCALRSEEHTSELQSHSHLVCRLLLVKKDFFPGSEKYTGLMRDIILLAYVGSHSAHPVQVVCTQAFLCPFLSDLYVFSFFFFNDPAPPEFYPFPLHDALPI